VKTHDLAKALETLARVLRSSPSVPLDEMYSLGHQSGRPPQPSEIPLALTTLVRLAEIDKKEWVEFIRQNSFPIEVRARDASRDVVGKLLRYLEQTPEARKKIRSVAERSRNQTSPELQNALDFLLKS
jgi:hypothetical protein